MWRAYALYKQHVEHIILLVLARLIFAALVILFVLPLYMQWDVGKKCEILRITPPSGFETTKK